MNIAYIFAGVLLLRLGGWILVKMIDISKIEGLLDETIVVNLPRDQQPNHEVHQRPDKGEPQFRQSLKPRSEQVGDGAGEEPEGEQVDISPA